MTKCKVIALANQKGGTAIGNRIAGSYHCRWNKWKNAQFPRRKDVECDRKDGLGEIRQMRKSQGIYDIKIS